MNMSCFRIFYNHDLHMYIRIAPTFLQLQNKFLFCSGFGSVLVVDAFIAKILYQKCSILNCVDWKYLWNKKLSERYSEHSGIDS